MHHLEHFPQRLWKCRTTGNGIDEFRFVHVIPLSLLLKELQKPCNRFYIKPFVLGQAIVEIFRKTFHAAICREISSKTTESQFVYTKSSFTGPSNIIQKNSLATQCLITVLLASPSTATGPGPGTGDAAEGSASGLRSRARSSTSSIHLTG